MLDFVSIKEKPLKGGGVEVYPNFIVKNSKDIMIRGKTFYAVWDESANLWSEDIICVKDQIDKALAEYYDGMVKNKNIKVLYINDFNNNMWTQFLNYINKMPDNNVELDTKILFNNEKTTKSSYASKKLDYDISENEQCPAWNEIIGTLYSEEDRQKIEWGIGSVFTGDSKNIQKFIVFYGPSGTGKSTILNIINRLFNGYTIMFNAKDIVSKNNNFATEIFKKDPLVAIQHDGDLSKIEDNTLLNSIVSHETIIINEKHKATYEKRPIAMLFMGSNNPVKITDSKSGIIRRLIDVRPSGELIDVKRYNYLMDQIEFELGSIARHCINVYKKLGKRYYDHYRPINMALSTNVFFNFVEENYAKFEEDDYTTLKEAYELFLQFCRDSMIDKPMPKYKFRDELADYWKEFRNIKRLPFHDGGLVRNYYGGFRKEKFKNFDLKEYYQDEVRDDKPKLEDYELKFDCTKSKLDEVYKDCVAQYANENGTPIHKWDNVKTTLKDIDTSKLHYVLPPKNHIVIDFDLKDETGKKSFEKNLEAASKFPPTYAELSKSGAGMHLHYIYEGDVDELDRIYGENIEIKVFTGKSSLRRMFSKCNDKDIATINSGLPKRSKKKMVDFNSIKSEKQLRAMIVKNLKKEIHHNTKPSIDFIFKLMDEAYQSGLVYDVTDMQKDIIAFASQSTNNAEYCLEQVANMKFKSSEEPENVERWKDDRLVFFDVEVFPNLFIVVYKFQGKDEKPIILINPNPIDIEKMLQFKLVGFNNRRYDNHILYGKLIGYDNKGLFELSQRIINNEKDGTFLPAYNISYADIYDFTTLKQSLKKYELELGFHHQECDLPWDKDVPENKWKEVANYCVNDVLATEAVFESKDIQIDFTARKILADISGLSVNDSTRVHTGKIIFGNDKKPQEQFIYTDLATGKQYGRGEVPNAK